MIFWGLFDWYCFDYFCFLPEARSWDLWSVGKNAIVSVLVSNN
ncbi:MAG: hypothetical protein ACRCT1_10400 [Microcoleaceae cyanobacterium]